MAKGNFNYTLLTAKRRLSKGNDIIPGLARISKDEAALQRIEKLSKASATRIDAINVAPPAIDGKRTNPFVLAAHARKSKLKSPFDLDLGLAAAKEFSGLETALGRIVEDLVPQIYGWEQVHSKAHSVLTEIDSAKKIGDTIRLAALKSGPACMNDTMVNKIGGAVAEHYVAWAEHWSVSTIEFTVGMNYSTGRNSNKKDWHAVRLAEEQLYASGATIIDSCIGNRSELRPLSKPGFIAEAQGIQIKMHVRQGIDFWGYIADPVKDAYLEICCALAKSAAPKASFNSPGELRTEQLLNVASNPNQFSVPYGSPISNEQLPWLFLFVRHFVDELTP